MQILLIVLSFSGPKCAGEGKGAKSFISGILDLKISKNFWKLIIYVISHRLRISKVVNVSNQYHPMCWSEAQRWLHYRMLRNAFAKRTFLGRSWALLIVPYCDFKIPVFQPDSKFSNIPLWYFVFIPYKNGPGKDLFPLAL